MIFSLEAKRSCTAEVFAYVVLNIFPGTKIVDCKPLPYGFSYSFANLNPHLPIELIEDHLNRVRVESIPIETKFMMPKNASQFFLFKKQEFLAKNLQEDYSSLISILHIDDFASPCSEPHFLTTKETLLCKILHKKEVNGWLTFEVAAFEDKESLKKFIKDYQHYQKNDPIEFMKKQNWLTDLGWCPDGVTLINLIQQKLHNFSFKHGFVSLKPFGDVKALMKEQKIEKASVLNDFGLNLYFLTNSLILQKEILNLLQFINKSAMLLGLQFEKQLFVETKNALFEKDLIVKTELDPYIAKETQVHFFLQDTLGRKVLGAQLKVKKEEDSWLVEISLFPDLVQCAKHIVEVYQGQIPFWLAPIQVEVVALSKKAVDYAAGLKKKLDQQGIRVRINESVKHLKQTAYAHHLSKTPYLLVLGDKEIDSGTLSVRNGNESKPSQMNESEFFAHMMKTLEENFESQ